MHASKSITPWWPWAICGILLVATLLNYMDRQALAVTLPALKVQFNLAEGRVGMVEGCFGYAFAFGAIFFGLIADKTGPRFLYPIVLGGWSLAGIATSLAGQTWLTSILESPDDPVGTGVYHWLLICRVALGFFEAGHWPCALLTVRAILNERDRTLGNGILQSGASIGAVIVPFYVEAAEWAGQSWEFPFWSIGIVGLLWIPAWFALVTGRDLSTPKVDAGDILESNRMSGSASQQLSDLTQRLIVLAIMIATLTVSWQFLRAWLALFLQDHHHYSKEATRGLMAGYFIAADVGCILSGVLVKRLVSAGWQVHRSRLLGYFIFSLLTACGAMVPYAGNGWVMNLLLFTAGAGILGLHPYYYAFTQEISHKYMGTFSGFLAAGGWIVSATTSIYIGRQIEASKSYELGLLMVGLAPMIGFVVLFFLWPRK
jgi:ACS family hexuronate transporter-like MFS transporter